MLQNDLRNGHMELSLYLIYFNNGDTSDNIAILKRKNDNTFIVVRYIDIDEVNLTCQWGHAIEYDIETLKEAVDLFISKVR